MSLSCIIRVANRRLLVEMRFYLRSPLGVLSVSRRRKPNGWELELPLLHGEDFVLQVPYWHRLIFLDEEGDLWEHHVGNRVMWTCRWPKPEGETDWYVEEVCEDIA
jgi:hypothetical protein